MHPNLNREHIFECDNEIKKYYRKAICVVCKEKYNHELRLYYPYYALKYYVSNIFRTNFGSKCITKSKDIAN